MAGRPTLCFTLSARRPFGLTRSWFCCWPRLGPAQKRLITRPRRIDARRRIAPWLKTLGQRRSSPTRGRRQGGEGFSGPEGFASRLFRPPVFPAKQQDLGTPPILASASNSKRRQFAILSFIRLWGRAACSLLKQTVSGERAADRPPVPSGGWGPGYNADTLSRPTPALVLESDTCYLLGSMIGGPASTLCCPISPGTGDEHHKGGRRPYG